MSFAGGFMPRIKGMDSMMSSGLDANNAMLDMLSLDYVPKLSGMES